MIDHIRLTMYHYGTAFEGSVFLTLGLARMAYCIGHTFAAHIDLSLKEIQLMLDITGPIDLVKSANTSCCNNAISFIANEPLD